MSLNPGVLYRIYDADDVLLYIGSTDDLPRRILGHFQSQWSCSENLTLRERFHSVYSVQFDTLEDARAAEKAAIREEGPLLNKMHNPKRWRKGLNNSWHPVVDSHAQVPA